MLSPCGLPLSTGTVRQIGLPSAMIPLEARAFSACMITARSIDLLMSRFSAGLARANGSPFPDVQSTAGSKLVPRDLGSKQFLTPYSMDRLSAAEIVIPASSRRYWPASCRATGRLEWLDRRSRDACLDAVRLTRSCGRMAPIAANCAPGRLTMLQSSGERPSSRVLTLGSPDWR